MIAEEIPGEEKSVQDALLEQQMRQQTRNAARARRIGRLERRWWGRTMITLFILWHAFALFIWLVPSNSAIVQGCVGTIRPYMMTTGFAQSWSMFSPNPDHMDVYLTAQITYADGSKRPWEFPRMVHLNYAKRYEEERWRKMTENATHSGTPLLWPGLARYAARVNNRQPHNPPVSVALTEYTRNIPPPGMPISATYQAVPMQTGGKLFTQPITAGDLR